MKKLVVRDTLGDVRLIPPGKTRRPWFGSAKKYPSMGRATFCQEMTEQERDILYEIYCEKGQEALKDAVEYLSRKVWLPRHEDARKASENSGRHLMEEKCGN